MSSLVTIDWVDYLQQRVRLQAAKYVLLYNCHRQYAQIARDFMNCSGELLYEIIRHNVHEVENANEKLTNSFRK